MKFKFASLLVVIVSVTATMADGWSGFQNGGKLGIESEGLPVTWSSSQGIAWEVSIVGYGQSSPVVHGEHVYCTSCSGENKENLHVICFDLSTGKSKWQYALQNSSPEKNTSYVSRAAPSATCDQDGVIAFFEGGNVVALNHKGELRWQRDLVADYGPIKARHGLSSSLEQNAQDVFVWIEREQDPYIVALKKESGETRWKTPGIGSTSWSSPRLVPVGDSAHLVVSGIGKLAGYDPTSGGQLWSLDGINGNSTPTPIPLGEGRFLIGATTGRGASAGGGRAAKSNGVIQISERDDGSFHAAYLWQAKQATSSFGSPLAVDGLAYFVNAAGVVYCLDIETGKQLYAKRTDGSTWATPIASGNHIYVFGKNGNTTVFEAGPAFEQVSVNSMWQDGTQTGRQQARSGSVLYAAAVAGSDFILRSGNRLYKIGD